MFRPLALLLALACGAAHAADLTVSAAASLMQALRELAPMFESAHAGTRVRLNFGASGALLQQLSQGAPVDVFASADTETMDRAQALGLVRGAQRRNFASNALVLIVPSGATQPPSSLAALARPEVRRVAIGLPASVPVGRYAKAALDAAGLWAAVEPKMIGAHSVRQALVYVARAEVDAGFVYATDAALLPGKVKIAFQVPTATRVLYPAAPVAASAQPELARRFVEFLATPAAQALLAQRGFGKP